ncbi:MAG: hypothetical protein GF405_00860 [Candidatus Eisenbacteria bacterium]|nr:hypothetical protein [Candidatus Eisenbacteria bacterium]
MKRDDAPEREPERERSGFRGQPLGLKLLLFASLIAIVVGVVRCSLELTTPLPPVERVGVSVASDSSLPDTLRRSMAARFARELAAAGSLNVELTGADAAGYDALAVVRSEPRDGGLAVIAELSDVRARRYLGVAEAVGPEGMVGDVAALAAQRAAPILELGRRVENEEAGEKGD